MSSGVDWRMVARRIMEETERGPMAAVGGAGRIVDHAMLLWRGSSRLGLICTLDDGVVLVNVDSGRLPPLLYRAYRAEVGEGRVYAVDDNVDLSGRVHFLARRGERVLGRMNPEQTRYSMAVAAALGAIMDMSDVRMATPPEGTVH